MKRKYLDDISVTNRPEFWGPEDERNLEWEKQREEYGFDERETWSLEYSFRLWLYERLKMYLECADGVVNLEYHKFTFRDKTYTQKEIINMMLERLEFSFSPEYDDWDNEHCGYINEIGELWALVLPAMWW